MAAYRFPSRQVDDPRAQRNFEQLEGGLQVVGGNIVSKGALVDFFRLEGANENYVTVNAVGQGCYIDASQSVPFRWVYTPEVDVYAEVTGFVGIVTNFGAAAWDYLYLTQTCTPADALGADTAHQIMASHNAGVLGHRMITRTWVLEAGTEYTIAHSWSGTGGAVWQHFQGRDYMYLEGKAWVR